MEQNTSLIAYQTALLSFRELKGEECLAELRALIKMHTADLGFSLLNQTKIVTAASELGRNTYEHGLGGTVKVERLQSGVISGIRLVFTDSGPGISDLSRAMSGGFSSKQGMGYGLSGAKRLMDSFDINTAPGEGTTITVTKWK